MFEMMIGDLIAVLILFLIFYKLDYWAAKWVVERAKKLIDEIKKDKDKEKKSE